MKCFFIVTKSETVLTFRRSLIESLLTRGHHIGVIAHDSERQQDIQALNVDFYCVEQENRSLNPLSSLQYKRKITKILKTEKPDLVFTFQLKPNTFGVQAACKAGIKKIYAMVEGAGDVFINDSLKWKAIRFVVCTLYKKAFRHTQKVFFLNGDDQSEFLKRKLVPKEKATLIPGVGVDLQHFAEKPLKETNSFLMIARMLKTKGVEEYCQCARLVRQKHPEARFCYLGAEGTVTLVDIQEYLNDGSVCYLGTTKDVRPYLEECTALILPSYREGMPMAVMEAEAVGRAVIVSDSVGCKDTVIDGFNGFLVSVRDSAQMAERCCYLLENPDIAVQMGNNSRQLAQDRFDEKKINQMILDILKA